MAPSDFTILLQAQLDTSGIQAQLESLAGKYKINLQANIDPAQTQAFKQQVSGVQDTIAAKAKTTPVIDIKTNLDDLSRLKDSALNIQAAVSSTATKTKLGETYVDGIRQSITWQEKFTDEEGRTVVQTNKWTDAQGEVNGSLKTTNTFMQDVGKTSQTTLSNIIANIKQTVGMVIQWTFVMGTVMGTLRSLSEGIGYIKDLNKELINTQIVTGMTDEEIKKLSTDYNELAKQMGATTLDVAKGSLEWFRQGKTAQEALQLTQSSLMMAKLGNLEAAQSTEYLTSILNGFKISADGANATIDKMVAIDNSAATSVGEIATAMQYSSAVAQQSGVSFDELAAYIGTVSSVSRMSAETVGQSMKTMLTRMESVKAGAIEDGIGLNNVEKALSNVNIKLRESNDTFRPMGEVLSDIATKWDSLSQVQQNQIGTAIAGIRQMPQFLILMQNWNEVLRLQGVEATSAGLATDRYNTYLKSVEASANRMQAAWQGVWQTTLNSQAIKFFYDFSASVGNAINAMGGLGPIIIAVASNFLILKSAAVVGAFQNIVQMVQTVIASLKALQVTAVTTGAMMSTALGAVGLIISAVMIAWSLFSSVVGDVDEKISKLDQDIKTLSSDLTTLQGNSSKVMELWNSYQTLKDITSKTNEQQKQFVDVQNQIKQVIPDVAGEYDRYGNFILDASVNLSTLIKLQQDKIALDQKELDMKMSEELKLRADQYLKEADALKVLVDRQAQQQALLKKGTTPGSPGMLVSDKQISDQKVAVDGLLNAFEQMYVKADQATKTDIINYLNGLGEAGQDAARQLQALGDAATGAGFQMTEAFQNGAQEVSQASKDAFEALLKDTISLIKQETEAQIDSLQKQLDALKDNLNDKKEEYKTYYEELKNEVNGQIDALRRQQEADKAASQAAIDAIQAQIDRYNDLIDAQKEALRAKEAEREFDEQRKDNQTALAKIQEQIAALQLDTSAEGIAKRLQLEDEAKKLQAKMADDQSKHDTELQIDALDKEKKRYEDKQKLRIQDLENEQKARDAEYKLQLEALQNQIKSYETSYQEKVTYLDNENKAAIAEKEAEIKTLRDYLTQSGTIANDARARLASGNEELYKQLTEWNHKYGTGIDEDITNMWKTAQAALQEYIDTLKTVPITPSSTPTPPVMPPFHGYHGGADMGFVGNLNSNEEFAKLMKGELVVNPIQMNTFMGKTLPSIAGANSGMSIDRIMDITVQGNLDKSVIPDLEKIANDVANKLAQKMGNRGMVRQANAFSI